jgi:hypothetical protein
VYSRNALLGKEVRSLNKRPLSEVFMLVSCVFCRSIATYQHMAIVSFAENGRFLGLTKDGLMIFGSYNQKKTAFY